MGNITNAILLQLRRKHPPAPDQTATPKMFKKLVYLPLAWRDSSFT